MEFGGRLIKKAIRLESIKHDSNDKKSSANNALDSLCVLWEKINHHVH